MKTKLQSFYLASFAQSILPRLHTIAEIMLSKNLRKKYRVTGSKI
uniref:Uncharacterized protein n=1 Tax=Rhizophora mucronata TaxID=61149 RepID=A0A2P2N362_RHIMU